MIDDNLQRHCRCSCVRRRGSEEAIDTSGAAGEVERQEKPNEMGPKYQLIWARDVDVSWDAEDSWNGK